MIATAGCPGRSPRTAFVLGVSDTCWRPSDALLTRMRWQSRSKWRWRLRGARARAYRRRPDGYGRASRDAVRAGCYSSVGDADIWHCSCTYKAACRSPGPFFVGRGRKNGPRRSGTAETCRFASTGRSGPHGGCWSGGTRRGSVAIPAICSPTTAEGATRRGHSRLRTPRLLSCARGGATLTTRPRRRTPTPVLTRPRYCPLVRPQDVQ